MTEIVIERPDVTYEITVDDNTYVIDGRFIYTNTDFDAETLQGEGGKFYLDRTNHTGSEQISDVTGLQDTLDLKLDAADYNDRFLGLFSSVFDLEAAHPTANAGDYAQVDFGIGTDVIVYAWDVSDTKWSAVGSSAIANTDALPEGSSNLYLTGQRVRDTPLAGLSIATATPITASDSVLGGMGKLQAQISAAGGGSSGGFYVSGIEYSQDANSAATSGGAIAIANPDTLTLYPVRVVEDVLIDQYSVVTGNTGGGVSPKFTIYEAVAGGGEYFLERIVDQSIVSTSQASTKYNIATSATLKANKLYFFGLISDSTRNYLAVPLTNAISLGYAISSPTATKTTALRSGAFRRTSDHPSSLNTAGFTAVTTVPIEFRFRVASA